MVLEGDWSLDDCELAVMFLKYSCCYMVHYG